MKLPLSVTLITLVRLDWSLKAQQFHLIPYVGTKRLSGSKDSWEIFGRNTLGGVDSKSTYSHLNHVVEVVNDGSSNASSFLSQIGQAKQFAKSNLNCWSLSQRWGCSESCLRSSSTIAQSLKERVMHKVRNRKQSECLIQSRNLFDPLLHRKNPVWFCELGSPASLRSPSELAVKLKTDNTLATPLRTNQAAWLIHNFSLGIHGT